ncbi:WD repeat-containing protein 36 [Elysia marginata]|uniref:WD repeat-containing protein 36 n=1 Tax=Elysia marginata TaxID=1093978 RepID=A0AAV4IV65_9GAST|nr:WD repeat-containing protein 36 [Elysia marginata]
MSFPSKIFVGYRALGFVSNHIPLVTRYHKRHRDNYVITCVGQSFHVYNVSKLGIVAVSDPHPEDISVLAADFRYVFTASGNRVFAVSRNKKIEKEYKGHKADVTFLLPFSHHLISVDVDGSLIVWDIASQEQYLQLKFDPETFLISAVCHPHTYVNKILLGSQQGGLQLWNIKSNKLVYSFSSWGSPVTAIQQSTAIDVMAIGLADGQVILHNLALDKVVVRFKQDYGPVTCVAFRSDGHPMMVTGSTSGHIALWDLENRKLHSYMKEAHFSSITGLSCLPSEPLMVTSAADNSLKVWIFDLADGGARLLRLREGHSAPPSCVRFYGNDGQNILSAGHDSTLRSFSTTHDKHNKNLGRASYHKKASKRAGLKHDKHKMPPIVKLAADPSRESDWDNILATHRSSTVTTTWNYQRCTMGKYKFIHERFKNDVAEHSITATAVDISSCGNFGLIGYSSGHVDMYNMQSGLHRGTLGEAKAHDCTVRGISIDGLNQKVVSAGANGVLKFWRFKNKQLLGQLKMEAFVSQTMLHRDSSMLAVALDDFSICIVDIDTRRVVRRFAGHSAAISDLTFRADGRWLISASMDCTIRTWNLPTGSLVDAFALQEAATSVSMSPCGNFLTTTHVGDVGVYLWSNRTLYSHVFLRPLPADYEPRLAELPTTVISDSDNHDSSAAIDEDEENGEEYKSPEQIADELVTLSLLPTSRWLNLLNLDIIKIRNKPKEPPKVPKAAPFFLPTVAGLEPKFDIGKGEDKQAKAESHIKKPKLGALSELAQHLSKGHKTKSYSEVMACFKEMGPSKIDSEIRLLSSEEGGSNEVMSYFLEFIETILQSNKDFELAHAYLALFLKVHGEELSGKPELSSVLQKLSSTQFESWQRVEELLQKSLGLVAYLRSATV